METLVATTETGTAGPATVDVDRLAHPTDADVAAVDAWWRANNYLTVGQIYLMANPEVRAWWLGDWAEQG
jgi:xylulose-5-phosphate/fructose-6-phosphate phosphoketolase